MTDHELRFAFLKVVKIVTANPNCADQKISPQKKSYGTHKRLGMLGCP